MEKTHEDCTMCSNPYPHVCPECLAAIDSCTEMIQHNSQHVVALSGKIWIGSGCDGNTPLMNELATAE